MKNTPITVLVVDDSDVARMHLAHILEADPAIRVVGSVHTGQAAVDFMKVNTVDAILMDLHMPDMDGFEATRRIMETQPVPIVICTASMSAGEVATTFRGLEAGAIACVQKPPGAGHPDYEPMAAHLRQTLKLMSEVKVVRRWPKSRISVPPFAKAPRPASAGIQLIGIGASTGGPPVLQAILAALPKDFPVPILIVQHITHGFLPGLVEWLGQTTRLQIQIGAYGACPSPGHVYLAPDGMHMGVTASGRILLTREDPENGLRPAVSYLFRSLAETCGAAAVGVLLTGMGKDGAVELKLMRDRGAITMAQDRESSVIHGMPGEAIALGAAAHVLAPEKIAEFLLVLAGSRKGGTTEL